MSNDQGSSDQSTELRDELTTALNAAANERDHGFTLIRAHEALFKALRTEINLQIDRTLSRYREITSDWPDQYTTPKIARVCMELCDRMGGERDPSCQCPKGYAYDPECKCSACTAGVVYDDQFDVALQVQCLLDDALIVASGHRKQTIKDEVENVFHYMDHLLDQREARERVYSAVRAAIGGVR